MKLNSIIHTKIILQLLHDFHLKFQLSINKELKMKKLVLLILPFFFTGCIYYTDTLAYNNGGYYSYGYVPNYGYSPYYNSYNYYYKKDWHEHSHHHERRDDWKHHR